MLSPSQQEAEKAFLHFLGDDNQHSMVIAGFAGSGKSYLVKYLYQTAKNYFQVRRSVVRDFKEPIVFFTATTNKATSVLCNFINQPTSTIHSLLGLKVKNDLTNGQTILEKTDRTKPIVNALIFIDEASMIDRKLYITIKRYTKEAKVVFIGDNYQLPPVFENGSIVFNNPNTVYLKEIQRQVATNPIILLSQKYRDVLDNGIPFSWPDIVPDNKHIFHVNGDQFEDLVRDKYSKEHDPNDYKILAYTNKKVIAYNKFVRHLYTNSNDFQPEEYVMTNKPIMHGNSIIYPTESIIKILDVTPAVSDEGLDGFNIRFPRVNAKFYPKNWSEADSLLKFYRKNQAWRKFFKIKEDYLDIRSLHALTCHKAQGSTYKEVFVDLDDIGINKKYYEVARLVYVAITRASDKVYLYGKLPDRWRQ